MFVQPVIGLKEEYAVRASCNYPVIKRTIEKIVVANKGTRALESVIRLPNRDGYVDATGYQLARGAWSSHNATVSFYCGRIDRLN